MNRILVISIFWVSIFQIGFSQDVKQLWESPPEESKSWVFWHWVQGAVSKEGITADLEAMKASGIAGAYLMPIKGVPEQPFVTPIVEQLSPLWWEMVDHAFKEADRIEVKMGFHICDGFALAGGPWITPQLSMQKVVWSKTNIQGGKKVKILLPQPESYKGYYKDIATFAYPTPQGESISTETVIPKATTSLGTDVQFLVDKENKEAFRSDAPCWIQYAFDKPFTCRSIVVSPSGNNFQAQRLTILASDDGINFRKITQLQPPRQGWQNTDFEMTHSIEPTTARYFRFDYNKSGTEPGSEDLDAAKWKQSLKIRNIQLSSEARIHQYEGKAAYAWRVSPRTTDTHIPSNLCIDPHKMIDISHFVDNESRLNWEAPKGSWTILRMGHTSTGHTNATGGKGTGLECDKFNPEAIRLQIDSWFGKAYQLAGNERASRILKLLLIDSWECGNQNWSTNFREEFKARRGYDVYNFLPVMAGVPMESAETSERILYDVRQTISELVKDIFYATVKQEVNARGCQLSAECVSPTMMSDGMLHYQNTDIPMGEFWLQSPTHDKPNDILDAISGAHIYEKNIIQAEAFTQLRTMFNEHPAMLKSLQDRHYALGINRLAYHVYVQNPWLDRQPGMTLDGIGLYFQRDQTWWKPGKAWVDYAQRCQALLQFGKPVVDIAVFTGEELPRRAILPDRLVSFLPGIVGKEKVEQENIRLANVGEPTRQMPVGVNHSSHITGAESWVNALRGYAYDSFNRDILLKSTVENGRIVLPNGMSYGALVVPGKHPMQPDANRMSKEVADKIKQLSAQGAKVLIGDLPNTTLGYGKENEKLTWDNSSFIQLPYREETFDKIGIERDFIVTESKSKEYAKDIAYAHRQGNGVDIYFISNQQDKKRDLRMQVRATGRIPELWNPVDGTVFTDFGWNISNERTNFDLTLNASESVFIILQTPSKEIRNWSNGYRSQYNIISSSWTVRFDEKARGKKEPVVFDKLTDWSENENEQIRYYSGTAVYANEFDCKIEKEANYSIEFEEIYNLAEVKINGKVCGTIWTKPYRLNITDALIDGKNTIEIAVTNTWANRIMGDEDFGAEKDDSKKIWTNARYRLPEKKLEKSGIVGNVQIEKRFNQKK